MKEKVLEGKGYDVMEAVAVTKSMGSEWVTTFLCLLHARYSWRNLINIACHLSEERHAALMPGFWGNQKLRQGK